MPVIDLFADAPSQRPYESAYLLAAYCQAFPEGSIFLCVVDPGVGGTRAAVALHADGRWFVGPDNGLLEIVRRHARTCQAFGIVPSRQPVSASFHGRDVFAPAVAALARGMTPQQAGWLPQNLTPRPDWPDDYSGIIYICLLYTSDAADE